MKVKNSPMPSPSDIAYIERGIFDYIEDCLRDKQVDYTSPSHDFIRNEVLREVRSRIFSSVQPK
ncbi:MAG: hypothetical protein [Caudoviricetes sp.]|nr:MAG: hypothetical protein [Caudoviricetes sp.]